ncbi:C-C motif chemokine 25 [Heterocephalus glaber]|uniref:C-C motif chemokine 25 n=1 Tax=Heterocephalus glaber TaxID=10181 RepID=G5B4M7_HETGA|nr:C-C motif chemokine 25 [Heterocephalus glaber]
MNPWLLTCLVASFVGAWVPAVHTQGLLARANKVNSGTPKMPLNKSKHHMGNGKKNAGLPVLLRTRNFWWQEVSGSCNLPAVIFYFPQLGRTVCGNPQDRVVRKAMKILSARRQSRPRVSNNIALQGLLARANKVNSGTPKMPLNKSKHHMGNGKKNAGTLSPASPGSSDGTRGLHLLQDLQCWLPPLP